MVIYIFLAVTLFILSMFNLKSKEGNITNKLFLIIIVLIAILFSSFRGPFTADYNGYKELFYRYNRYEGFADIFDFQQEAGFVLLNKVSYMIIEHHIFLMALVSILIILLNFTFYRKNSDNTSLSMLFFIILGSFYPSFNLMRQILAASILLFSIKHIKHGNIIRFLIIILIASLFHQTSLIFVIFYFIFNKRPMNKQFNYAYLAFTVLIYLNLYEIIAFINRFIYRFYSLDWYGFTGFNFNNLILPIILTVLIVFLEINLDKNNTDSDTISFYRKFFWALIVLTLYSTKIQVLFRFTYIFQPVVFLYIPYMIHRQKNKGAANIIIFSFIFLMIIVHLISIYRSEYNPYIFETFFRCSKIL